MSNPTTSAGFSSSTPAPDNGYQNAKPRDTGTTPLDVFSFEVPNTGGTSVKTANYTAVAGDCGTLIVFNSGSAVTLTLPAAPPFAQWQIAVQNIGAGTLTVNRNGLNIDGAAANLTLAQNAGISLYTDGSNYFTERGITSVTSLTTTGTSGAATLSAGVLNIPVYSSGGGGGLFSPVLSATPTRSGIGLTTTFNTSGTFTQADNAMGITIADTVGTAGENFEGIVKAYPGSSFTLNALVAGPFTGSAFVCVGLVIMASTSGKLIFFGWRWTSSGNVWQPCVMAYTSPTAFSSFLYTPSINQFPMTGWFQIADNGTNVSFNLSTDGVFWQTVYTVSKAASFLGASGFNYIGFAIDRSNGAIGGTLASWSGA